MKEKKTNGFMKFLAIIGCLAVIAAIAYAVYKFFTPDYLEDYEDDFDDDFDDFFEPVENIGPTEPAPAEEAPAE